MELAHAQWDTIAAFLEELECPVYLTPGNHDIWSDESESVYRERAGSAPYYSFDHQDAHFVVLDNSRLESWNEADAEMIDWLETDLASAQDARHIFVFAHKPLWTQTLALGREERIHDLFAAHGVDVHFTGHLHHYFSAEYDGVAYVSMGSSGGGVYPTDDADARGQFFQFGWVTVSDEDYELAIVELGAVHGWEVSTFGLQQEIRLAESECVHALPIVLEGDDRVDGEITVSVENRSPHPIDDAITWDVPDGWTVDPLSAPVSLAPDESIEMSFRATAPEDLFPVPTYSVGYPLSDGREIRATGAPRVVRVAEAAALESPPALDGRVSEPCWRRAVPEEVFYASDGTPGVEGETAFRFGYDRENLYVAAVCRDAGIGDLSAEVVERDGPVYAEDCVGFFIQPDRDAMEVYQIYVNPRGTLFDQRITFDETMWYTTHIDWNGDIDAATSRHSDRWSVEVSIPFSAIGLDGPPEGPVGLNFRRKQPDAWPPADWQVPIDYDPHTFGQLRFVAN
jgi:hypothetical protein